LRNDNCDGLANRLFGRVAEGTFRTPIPACDNAIEVLAYNCIVTGLNDRSQPTQSLFTFTKLSLDLLALGNVDSRRMQKKYCPRPVANGMHGKVHDALAAIGHPVSKFFAEDRTRSRLLSSETNPCLHLF
jgi:hypothetical protein